MGVERLHKISASEEDTLKTKLRFAASALLAGALALAPMAASAYNEAPPPQASYAPVEPSTSSGVVAVSAQSLSASEVSAIIAQYGSLFSGFHSLVRVGIKGHPGQLVRINVTLGNRGLNQRNAALGAEALLAVTGIDDCLALSNSEVTIGADGNASVYVGYIFGEDVGNVNATLVATAADGSAESTTLTFAPDDYLDTTGAAAARGCITQVAAVNEGSIDRSATVRQGHPTTGAEYTLYAIGGVLLIGAGAAIIVGSKRRRAESV